MIHLPPHSRWIPKWQPRFGFLRCLSWPSSWRRCQQQLNDNNQRGNLKFKSTVHLPFPYFKLEVQKRINYFTLQWISEIPNGAQRGVFISVEVWISRKSLNSPNMQVCIISSVELLLHPVCVALLVKQYSIYRCVFHRIRHWMQNFNSHISRPQTSYSAANINCSWTTCDGGGARADFPAYFQC